MDVLRAGNRLDGQVDHATGHHQPDDLARSPRGGDSEHQKNSPQQRFLTQSELGQFDRRARDDADDRRANAVKKRLHPIQPAVAHVSRRQNQHHQKRRQHKCDPHQSRSQNTGAHIPEIHRQLRRQRPGRKLRQRQACHIVFPRNPATPVDQVLLHPSRQRNGAAKANCPQPQEVSRELGERHMRRVRVVGF